MKTKFIRTLMLTAGMLVALVARATDYTWSNTATDAAEWNAAANWTAGGAAATDVPTNAADTATFPAIDTTTRTVNVIPKQSGWSGALKSVTGGAYWKLVFNAAGDGTYNDYAASFGIADVNAFTGIWSSTGKKTMVLTAASGTQTLTEAYVAGRFAIDVENAATTADILQLRGSNGSLLKKGAGDLRVRKILEPGSLVLELEEGNVTIDGTAASVAEPTAVLKKSAVWLDASNRETWQDHAYRDDAGRTRITNWVDAAGRSIKAEIWDNSGDKTDSHIKDVQPPFVSAATSTTGLPLIDFGAGSDSAAKAETYGPQAIMRLTTRFTNAKEIFYVAASTDEGEPLGDDESYDLTATSSYVLAYPDNVLANGGFAHFNGYERTPDCVVYQERNAMPRQTDAFTPTKQGALQMAHIVPGAASAQRVHYLAADRLYKDYSGGVRIGEVLIFTATLSATERQQVSDYLMNKWFSRASGNGFDLANVKDATSITVPAGNVVRIGTLRSTGTTFTKKGAGTLQIGRVYPEDLTITVAGGDLKVNTSVRTGTPTAPSGTPGLWLDADADGAFATEGDDVTAWNDCRGNGQKATRLGNSGITAYPQADTTRVSGRTALTFPDKAAFTLPVGWTVREVFIACCYTAEPSYYNIIGCSYRNARRMKVDGIWTYGYAFGTEDNSLDVMAGGTCSVDGKPVRPFEQNATLFAKDRWFVAHISTTAGTWLSWLASDGPRNMTGHVSYGEVITYDDVLSPEERTQTIDYLMNKWLGRRHPEYAAPAADPTLAYAGDATVSSDTDATLAEVTGRGTLTKTDDGNVTVTAKLAEDFTALAVRGGSLTITQAAQPTDDSIYHFDFGDKTTYATSYADGDGLTRVSEVADVRANGITAASPGKIVPSTGNYLYATNPVVRTGATGTGVTRAYFDFLTRTGRNVDPATQVGAGYRLKPTTVETAALSALEIHAVVAPHASDSFVLNGYSRCDFRRGYSGRLLRKTGESSPCPDAVREGYIAVDAQTATEDYVPANNVFHLFSFAPQEGADVSSINLESTINVGGSSVGEIVAFGTACTAAERTWWQRHLMHKWIDATVSDAVWTNAFESVTLSDGATLTVTGGGSILAPVLTGGGTIAAPKVMGISTLNLTATGSDAVAALAVSGTASFADAVSVSVTGGANLKAGTYTLVSASGLENVNLANWKMAGSFDRPYWFKQEGNAVKLVLVPCGFGIFLR